MPDMAAAVSAALDEAEFALVQAEARGPEDGAYYLQKAQTSALIGIGRALDAIATLMEQAADRRERER